MQTDNAKIATKLEAAAERLTKTIDHLRRPMTQNPTPKRNRDYHYRLYRAADLERAQRALRALAAAHRRGQVPAELAGVTKPVDVENLVHKGIDHRGYYEVVPRDEYADKSPAGVAMQRLLEGGMSEADRREAEERQRADEIHRLEEAVRFAQMPEFFPTPPSIIERMLELAPVRDGMAVLEPSAGKGDILDAVKRRAPGAKLTWCEIAPRLAEICRLKHPDAREHGDFLAYWEGLLSILKPGREVGGFDRILMNPPFQRGQDMLHVRKAYDLLAPGGRLVAIVSAGAEVRSDKRTCEFRGWLESRWPKYVELEPDAFNGPDAFKRTSVRARILVLDKPAVTEAPSGGNGDGRRHATAETAVVPAPSAAPPVLEPTSPANGNGHAAGNLLARYKPQRLAEIVGQDAATSQLGSFVASPFATAFLFSGPTGVGKTAAAWALADELGADPDWGGVVEIPAGKQDGRAVDELLRSLSFRPLGGSGWKVAIVNEADRMTPNAEAMWLDGLERLPAKTVVVFTTNEPDRLSQRFRRRCEACVFDGCSPSFREALGELVRRVYHAETGQEIAGELPAGLGQFDLADGTYSIGLALQQIAPYCRTRRALPRAFVVPLVATGDTSNEPAEAPTAPDEAVRGPVEARGAVNPRAAATGGNAGEYFPAGNGEGARPGKPAKAPTGPDAALRRPAEPQGAVIPQDTAPAAYKVRCQRCGGWIARGEQARIAKRCTSKVKWAHASCC